MKVFDRLSRIVRAQFNGWFREQEDPERALDAALQHLQRDLIQLRQAIAQAVALQKRCERSRHAALAQAQDWHQRAHLALKNGNEALARDALMRRQPYCQTAAALERDWQGRQSAVLQLRQSLRTLEMKVEALRTQRDLMIARARSARASQHVHDLTARVGTLSHNALEALEAKALYQELSVPLNAKPVEGESDTLKSEEIDVALASLKAEGQALP